MYCHQFLNDIHTSSLKWKSKINIQSLKFRYKKDFYRKGSNSINNNVNTVSLSWTHWPMQALVFEMGVILGFASDDTPISQTSARIGHTANRCIRRAAKVKEKAAEQLQFMMNKVFCIKQMQLLHLNICHIVVRLLYAFTAYKISIQSETVSIGCNFYIFVTQYLLAAIIASRYYMHLTNVNKG